MRNISHKQITDGNSYTTSYIYNLSGAMLEETYPSGRVVKNTLDIDGDLSQVQSRKANDAFRNYANSFNYTSAGAVSSMRLGNGRWENMTFNSRLQPTQIGLGTSATNQSLLKLNFDYGSTDNNGNIKSQTITVPTVGSNQGFTAVQTYTYDSLNRLKSATENINNNQTPSWKQTFTFDRYGNRRFDQANTTFPASFANPNITNPQIDTATNRFTSGQGYTYDSSGNLLTDAEGKSFVYDAENKQKSASNTSSTIGQYFYDDDGKRVKKVVPSTGETTIFVYDASGKMVAEYSTIVEPQATAKVSYLTNDHFGSPRIITHALGQVTSRRDFMPFGEEIYSAQRTQGLNYTADNIREKFATYERDDETKLNFAQARYQNDSHGRFTSPDPMMASATKINPQTFNRYSYVINNPLNLTDPSGLCPPIDNNPCVVGEKDEELGTFWNGTGWESPGVVDGGTVNGNESVCWDCISSEFQGPLPQQQPITVPNPTTQPSTQPTTQSESAASRFLKKLLRPKAGFGLGLLVDELANPSQTVGGDCDYVVDGCKEDEDEPKISLFHYTDKAGFNGIRATAPNYLFRASNPNSPNQVFGVYFTTYTPETTDLANKIRVSRAKTEYVFVVEIPLSSLRSINGGKSNKIFYSPTDIRATGGASRNPCFNGGC